MTWRLNAEDGGYGWRLRLEFTGAVITNHCLENGLTALLLLSKKIPIPTPPHATPSCMWRYPISKLYKYLFDLLHLPLRVACGGDSNPHIRCLAEQNRLLLGGFNGIWIQWHLVDYTKIPYSIIQSQNCILSISLFLLSRLSVHPFGVCPASGTIFFFCLNYLGITP